ncbi:RyR domain-containing protein [Amycolatopsis cynarae]|uniref:RyR domain-containing protein n=1 Tax=Amycolatopsis cynarae TaxID=2995223 RepID=A0ABY7B4Y2_9PSEU|nr:RyR domain-containing protein [Amycolatopsis sp. HUAS 11-8]WAL65858.1 RyR domain-containing protein [Amycolatopsis sp. HUAS 11-8]
MSLVLGYLGLAEYLAASTTFAHRPIDLVYYDLQLFVINSGPVTNGGPYPWPLEISRFLTPAVTAYAVLEAARLLFASEIARQRARRRSRHIVVCGDSDAAKTLAARLTDDGHRVVTVPSARTPRVLTEVGLARAARLYACADETPANIATVLAASQVPRKAHAPLQVHAHVADPELGDTLRGGRWREGMEVDFFSLEGVAAKKVLATEQPDGERLVVIGLSAFGRALLLELGRRAARARRGPVPVTVVDPDGSAVVAELRARHPFFAEACTVTVAGVYHPEPGVHRVFVCHDDEERALRDGLTAAATVDATRGTVIVRMAQLAGVGEMMVQHGQEDRLRFVGVLDMASVYLSERITDSLARAVHRRYLRDQAALGQTPATNSSLVPWEDLPETLRDANRAQAADIERKLALVGCAAVPSLEEVPFVFSPEEVELLAVSEHDRWMAERQSDGWRYGAVRDNEAKLHPDLRPWDELGEAERQKDRNVVLALPEILADAGFRIVRKGQRTR